MGQDRNGLPKGLEENGRQDDLLSYLWRRVMMGEDKGRSQGLRRLVGRTTLLSYLRRRVMRGEDRNGLPKGLEEAGRQHGL